MIRKATLEDLDGIMELVKEFHYAANLKRDALFEDSVKGWAAWIVACIEDPNRLCIVADSEGVLVGFLTAFQGAAFWNASVTLSAETAMWVSPAVRGQGVGGALIDALIAWARERGVKLVSAGANVNLGFKSVAKLLNSRGFALEEKIFALRLN